MNRTLLAVSLLLFVGAPVLAQAPTPTVDQIIDKYVEAIGGKAAFEKLPTRVMIGSFENERRGLTVPLEYSMLSLAGAARVAGREVYAIEAVPVEGSSERLYFDMQSGLLVRRDVQGQITPDGQSLVAAAIETYFEDYRTVDGVKLPFTIRRKLPGDAGNIFNRFREIKFNVQIDDSKFTVPNP